MHNELTTLCKLAQEVLITTSTNDPNYHKLHAIAALSEDLANHFIDDGK